MPALRLTESPKPQENRHASDSPENLQPAAAWLATACLRKQSRAVQKGLLGQRSEEGSDLPGVFVKGLVQAVSRDEAPALDVSRKWREASGRQGAAKWSTQQNESKVFGSGSAGIDMTDGLEATYPASQAADARHKTSYAADVGLGAGWGGMFDVHAFLSPRR
ncbi:hypothetical protein EIP86_003356 [Pleurotus ostreatoroseus]|nr:hypothetical protein EIP86_003356 [Pleurotus ostreatoroseus]